MEIKFNMQGTCNNSWLLIRLLSVIIDFSHSSALPSTCASNHTLNVFNIQCSLGIIEKGQIDYKSFIEVEYAEVIVIPSS